MISFLIGIVFFIIFLFTMVMGLLIRGITFYSRNTDNEKVVLAAAQAKQWGWPSGMHGFAAGKARMKEFAVLLLALVQRLFNDKKTDYSLVMLCLLANSLSGLLIFLIASNYWSINVGLVVFLLFMCSFWPQLIALWGGVVAVSQLCALTAIYFLQLSPNWPVFYLLAGLAFGFMLFSSASSRKYIPLVVGAFYWSVRGSFNLAGPSWLLSLVVSLIVFFVLSAWLGKIGFKKAVMRLAPKYLKYVDQGITAIVSIGLSLAIFLTFNILYSRSIVFWAELAISVLGIIIVSFILTYPNVLSNLRGYYFYSQYGKPVWRNRFYNYREYFASIGHPIKDDMRGAGLLWLVKYFWLMAPLQTFAFFISFPLVFYFNNGGLSWFGLAGLVLLSLSPILIGEITKGVQVGRSYYPGFVGILLLIGVAYYKVEAVWPQIYIISLFVILVSLIWNIWILLSDVLPARMAITNLINTLFRLKINKLYTYDTPYNNIFANCLPPDKFDIIYIRSIKEVKDGYIVIPGTSSKAVHMCDSPLAREKERGFVDLLLNKLIESREIANSAVASFMTFGSSRFWAHESEVPSYRALILGEVLDVDRWRGRAWILDAGKINC